MQVEQDGHLLGNWKVVREIGRGGMGVVHLAEHRFIPGKVAAVKVLQRELSRERTVTDRFFKEAVASSHMHHPGIVEVFDCGFSGDTAYLVMEYLEGENLGAWLQSGLRRVSLEELVGISRQIAAALEAAHRAGIVHRDLKPENVFVCPGAAPVVKVLDFGIAKLAPKGDPRLTRQGSILGTPRYMSPEQCRGDIDVDGRADVYALGCIMFEMACGWPPFVSISEGELFAAHLQHPPPDPAPFAPTLPPELLALILRALAKDPAQRPASMAALEAALAAILAPPAATVALPQTATVVLPTTVPATVVLPKPTPITTLSQAAVAHPAPEPEPEPEPAPKETEPKERKPSAIWSVVSSLKFLVIPAFTFAIIWFSMHPRSFKRLYSTPPPPVKYQVASLPAGARVCHPEDRKLLGVTPTEVESSDDPGGNRVIIELEGHRTQEVSLPLERPVRLKKLRGDDLPDAARCL